MKTKLNSFLLQLQLFSFSLGIQGFVPLNSTEVKDVVIPEDTLLFLKAEMCFTWDAFGFTFQQEDLTYRDES